MSPRLVHALAGLLLLTLLAACPSPRQATEVVVVIDSDLAIGTDLKSITVTVFDRDELEGEALRSIPLSLTETMLDGGAQRPTARHTLPLSFVLAPDKQKSARDFRLVVTGRDASDTEVVEQQAIASFRPNFSLRLDVFLGQRCIRQLCRAENGERISESCNAATGICEEVKESTLQPSESGELVGYSRADATISNDGDIEAADGGLAADDGEAADDTSLVDAAPPDLTVHALSDSGTHPVVAASRSGRGIVVWEERGPASAPRVELRAALYIPGMGWLPATNLSEKKSVDVDDSSAAVVMDERGNATLVWLRFFSLFGRRYSAEREAWDEEVELRPADAVNVPSLTIDPSGNVTASWSTMSENINSARFEADTGQWNSLVGYVNEPGMPTNGGPALSADGLGNVFAAWATNTYVWTNRYSTSSGRWETPVSMQLSTEPGVTVALPAIAGGNDGNALVLWRHAISSPFSFLIATNRYDYSRMAWVSTAPDDPASLRGQGDVSHVTADPLGGFVALWNDQVYSVSSDGTFGPARPIGRPGSISLTEAGKIDLKVDAHGTRLAGWAQNLAGGPDAVYSYAPRGGAQRDVWVDIIRLNVKLPDAPGMLTAGYPHLALGAPGQALMAWPEQAGETTRVRTRWLSYPSPAP